MWGQVPGPAGGGQDLGGTLQGGPVRGPSVVETVLSPRTASCEGAKEGWGKELPDSGLQTRCSFVETLWGALEGTSLEVKIIDLGVAVRGEVRPGKGSAGASWQTGVVKRVQGVWVGALGDPMTWRDQARERAWRTCGKRCQNNPALLTAFHAGPRVPRRAAATGAASQVWNE